MNEHFFGLGPGWFPQQADAIARRHGASLVNHTDPGCKCGHGCRDNCPACKRHWFSGPNRGEPFDSAMASAVLGDIAAAGITATTR